MDPALKAFADAVDDGSASIFIGAGLSKSAGYPTWSELLSDISDALKLPIAKVHDLVALAQWSVNEEGGSSKVRAVIKREIGKNLPVPEALRTVSRLPIRHIWTTNYDRLVERAFEEIDRPLDIISDPKSLTLRGVPGAARLYKMHGSIDQISEVVISTDDYELYRKNRSQYLPILEAHLTSTSMLFVGLSFSDPNLKHVLGAIRESFHEIPPEHFAIVRTPQVNDYTDREEYAFRLRQHELWSRDLRRYGLRSIEIDDFDKLPDIMSEIERHVFRNTVWINGAYPIDEGDRTEEIFKLSFSVGELIAKRGKKLLSGSGLTVGAGSISGFLHGLNPHQTWSLGQNLIVRAFPQYDPGSTTSLQSYWTSIREDMARSSGISIFVSGEKVSNSGRVISDGVLEEFDKALASGSFLIPIGASGGAAAKIADRLRGSNIPDSGAGAARPTDDEISSLMDRGKDHVTLIDSILDRVWRPSS